MSPYHEQQGVIAPERILVVEDDKGIRALVTATLESRGMAYLAAATGREAIAEASRAGPDVILLDPGLPDMDGTDIIRTVRQWSMVPIIVLSARSEDDDKVAALDAGADDYLTKPFSVDELLARLRAALRRGRYERGNLGRDIDFFENGPLRIDFSAGSARVNGQEIHLAPTEYRLLCLLARNAGKVLTHTTILQAVWGSSLPQNLPSLRVFMATLRKKLEAAAPQCNCIHTHVGVGYRMTRLGEPES
ncbi:response regulator transcription factor [Desulfovibrio sp. 1188_IL3213]|uniref:response regulator transcription factor n=1 Tax=Desulfovibrio sp. 1188_IL3213 TaxID=3084052 RepID=UPI002FD8B6BE